MITLRQLEAFCAVVESGSISVAAERLYLSQPAVSKIIASLEYRTQLTLFDREYRRIVPTAEARYLYKEARRLLAGLTDITRLAEELRTLNAGSVAIATLTAMGLQIVPSVLARFQQVRPNVDVTFQIRSPNKIMQWAIAQQIDFGIAITTMEHEAVSKETLCTTNGVCVMTQGHRLADRHRVDAADLHEVEFTASGKSIRVAPGETVHAAAAKVGLMIPKACGMGICGTCKVLKLGGEVEMEHNGGITEEDEAEGFILSCCSVPKGDVRIEF